MIMKTVIVLPAYNAEKTLARTIEDIPQSYRADVILVDDASTDGTVEVARGLGVKTIVHEKNLGYGGNQKTCYREALAAGADIVIMVHPDYQYNPKVIPHLVGLIESGVCDVVLGNRIRTRREALAGGMPAYKYLANRLLTLMNNMLTGENLGEWHSGMRAYSRKVLETVNWRDNSDDFVFDTQFLAECTAAGFRLGDIPVQTKYFAESSSINFRRSVVYGLLTVYTLLRLFLHKAGLLECNLFRPRAQASQ